MPADTYESSEACPRCHKYNDPIYVFGTHTSCVHCLTPKEDEIIENNRQKAIAQLWARHERGSLEHAAGEGAYE